MSRKPADMLRDYKPSTIASSFHRDKNKPFRGLFGPVNSGKSHACVMELLKWGMRMPLCHDGFRCSRFLVLGTSYPRLEKTAIPLCLNLFPPGEEWMKFWKTDRWLVLEFEDKPRIGKVRIEIAFRSLGIRGNLATSLPDATGAWFNEWEQTTRIKTLDIMPRLGRYPPRRALKHSHNFSSKMLLEYNTNTIWTPWQYKSFENEQGNMKRFCYKGASII